MRAYRIDEAEYRPGDVLPKSRVWEDGDPTALYLHGTCALTTDTPMIVKPDHVVVFPDDPLKEAIYWGVTYVVEGDYAGDGEDENEVILTGATVVRKITPSSRGGDHDF